MTIFDTPKGQRITDRRTICEVHREIYDRCIVGLQDNHELLDVLVPLLEEAFIMGTKMSKKLVEYKYSHFQHSDINKDFDSLHQLRKQRIMLNGAEHGANTGTT